MILLIWFASKVRNLLRKCLRSTASPLCKNYESSDYALKGYIEINHNVDEMLFPVIAYVINIVVVEMVVVRLLLWQ